MKKIFTICMLFANLCLFAQQKVATNINELVSKNTNFQTITPFSESAQFNSVITNEIVDKATYVTLNKSVLSDLMSKKYDNIELKIPYQNNTISVQLYKVNIFAEGFHLDTNKSKSVNYEPGVYYRGIVKGDSGSIASVSFFNNELSGIISARGIQNLVLGKLDKLGNDSEYIIYSDANLKVSNNFKCTTKDDKLPVDTSNRSEQGANRCVTMFFELDYTIYQRNGLDVTTTGNWLTAVFNNVQTLYVNDGISVALKSFFVWTTPDPYSGENSVDYLFQFNENTCVFDGDVGQLLGIDSGGLGGVAVGLNGLCTNTNFSYSDVDFSYSSVPTYSWTVQVITHEFGHLLGSPHTHNCVWNGNNTAIDNCAPFALGENWEGGNCMTNPPTIPYEEQGTIMSYCHLVGGVGISFNNGFGPQPAQLIRNKVNSSGCLGTNCTNTCINSVCSVEVSNVTSATATINWNETNATTTSWQLSIRPFDSTTNHWMLVSSTTFNATDLLPNTYYRVKVSPLCGSSFEAPSTEMVFLTAAAYCNGITLTDTGGISNRYEDDQNFIRTIIPNQPNKKIKLTFTAFSLEADYDYLYIYDGNSTDAPDLSNGGYTGTDNPGSFTSTAADGSLTLRFYSDGGVTDEGYVATVACENILATNEFVQNIDFTYYPNPTNGMLNINSKTNMSEIAVYNLAGQLLHQNKINALDAKVDMAAYAKGTYFVKLKFNEKEANFKIQRN